jgi:hypothetical protein
MARAVVVPVAVGVSAVLAAVTRLSNSPFSAVAVSVFPASQVVTLEIVIRGSPSKHCRWTYPLTSY